LDPFFVEECGSCSPDTKELLDKFYAVAEYFVNTLSRKDDHVEVDIWREVQKNNPSKPFNNWYRREFIQ